MEPHCEFGDARGFPVLYCHGTPGSAEECGFAHAAALEHHLRLIALDRPGYGRAAAAPGMTHAAWARHAVRVLAGLGIEHYAVLAVSGGTPAALAIAATDSRHVRAVGLVCPLGPYCEPQLAQATAAFARWLADMAGKHLHALDWLALRPFAATARILPQAVLALLRMSSARADRRTLARPEVASLLAGNLRRAFRQGSAGVAGDLLRMPQPWDFRLADVVAPVRIWHGTDDALLRLEHARWLAARLPDAELELLAGEGHISLPFGHAEAILGDLAARCQAGQATMSC